MCRRCWWRRRQGSGWLSTTFRQQTLGGRSLRPGGEWLERWDRNGGQFLKFGRASDKAGSSLVSLLTRSLWRIPWSVTAQLLGSFLGAPWFLGRGCSLLHNIPGMSPWTKPRKEEDDFLSSVNRRLECHPLTVRSIISDDLVPLDIQLTLVILISLFAKRIDTCLQSASRMNRMKLKNVRTQSFSYPNSWKSSPMTFKKYFSTVSDDWPSAE